MHFILIYLYTKEYANIDAFGICLTSQNITDIKKKKKMLWWCCVFFFSVVINLKCSNLFKVSMGEENMGKKSHNVEATH